ncbi:MAG TPA: hypothetical protein DEP69_04895, partial [Acidimicrobiaceae bacterium]|nr:hypothetical protein [Acidimicrobiaceae bacterium]
MAPSGCTCAPSMRQKSWSPVPIDSAGSDPAGGAVGPFGPVGGPVGPDGGPDWGPVAGGWTTTVRLASRLVWPAVSLTAAPATTILS